MIIIPAIDIQQGKVVRLLKGQFDQKTEYSDDPLATAQKWMDKGATWLHVVDLDGAQQGKVLNFEIIAAMAQSIDVPIEVGGGIRTQEDIGRYIEAGVRRVILGTKAVEDINFLKAALAHWHDKIALALDCLNGMVAQRGWVQNTDIKALDFAREMENGGVECLIYTDIQRDGTLRGPNLEGLKQVLKAVKISVIASGGITNLADIKNLCGLKAPNLIGAITGRAIYEGTLDLEKAIQICSQNV